MTALEGAGAAPDASGEDLYRIVRDYAGLGHHGRAPTVIWPPPSDGDRPYLNPNGS